MFRKMPILLIAAIIAILCIDPFLPMNVKQALYALSLTIKSVIVLFLPFIIFGLLFKASVSLSHQASRIIGLILVLVCCSNFLSTSLSHYVGMWIYQFDLSAISPEQSRVSLVPLWTVELPSLIANNKAMFFGIGLGLLSARFYPKRASRVANTFDQTIHYLLKAIVYFIPLFVIGFVVKLQFDGVVGLIFKEYTAIFAVIAISQFTYILLAYFMLSQGSWRDFIGNLKNMIPAAISGFSTMSSAASMPLTMMGVQRNTQNKDIASSVIPATVNIHLIGDCFAIPILAYAVLKSYGAAEPAMFSYFIFTFYFVLAKFSVAAIPGGGIIVMLPILEQYLGFNSEMMSLITALYILFDPVITSANVLGNGAFAKLIDRYFLPAHNPSSVES